MQVFNSKTYTEKLREHYETFFGAPGNRLAPKHGPIEKLFYDFYVLEFPVNKRHKMICYCTVGMSADRIDNNLIELIIYSPRIDDSILELLTVIASYHRNKLPLNIHHTVNIGQPWIDNSKCDHGFISLPYIEGDTFELFNLDDQTTHCYWFIPITEKERDFQLEKGCEALEQLFEDSQFDYLNPNRLSLID